MADRKFSRIAQNFKLPIALSLTALPGLGQTHNQPQKEEPSLGPRPNILVVVCEDISPYLGCYGDSVAVTPNLDRFSRDAVLHTHMFTCVGVSSPSRYSLITGRYSSEDGANYMRVTHFNKKFGVVPPEGVKCYTELMRREGYYCTNNAKTDYQFPAPTAAWDEQGAKAHWKHAPREKPFLSIFNLNITHESQIWKQADKPLAVDPREVVLPPYYPDTPVVRRDHAVLYSCIKKMDEQFEQLLEELENSDRRDNTIVIFYSDNGGPLPRQKREIMDSGTRVPFMIRFPDRWRGGAREEAMNMFVDIPATIMSLCGVEPPHYMRGEAFYGKYRSKTPRRYVFGATDRFDEQIEKRASIRDRRYLYIRNYMPEQSVYRPVKYRLSMPMMQEMLTLYGEERLDGVQRRWFEAPRSEEELYDCLADPHQIHNLADDPAHTKILTKMRRAYKREWIGPFNREWESRPESYFVERMWPGGEKPVCETPRAEIRGGALTVDNDPGIYSISYRREGEKKWNLYTSPVPVGEQEGHFEVLVERIGYTPSSVIL